jgi:GntR family transcriptional regulator
MSSIAYIIRPGDDLPIYRQIVRQIQEAIASGRFEIGERLPSHRELAKQLVIAPLTVKRAYDELERAGLVRSARGRGTFVAARPETKDKAQRLEGLRPQVRQLVHAAHLSGVGIEALTDLLTDEAARLHHTQEKNLNQEESS